MSADIAEVALIPNWKEADAYPPPTIEMCVFVWEFIRRSTEYRDRWRALSAEQQKHAPHPGNAHWRRLSPKRVEWDLTSMFRFSNALMPEHECTAGERLRPVRDGELHVVIDATKPLPEQIRRIQVLATEEQWRLKKTSKVVRDQSCKVDPKDLPTYLRILDAYESGATPKDMCAVLFAGQGGDVPKRLAQARAKAEKLRDGEALDLAHIKPSRQGKKGGPFADEHERDGCTDEELQEEMEGMCEGRMQLPV